MRGHCRQGSDPRQGELFAAPAVRGKVPTNPDRRTLLQALPLTEPRLRHRRLKRAAREAVRNGWAEWNGETLHATAKGRGVLAQLEGVTLEIGSDAA